jgi:hypothetical protein
VYLGEWRTTAACALEAWSRQCWCCCCRLCATGPTARAIPYFEEELRIVCPARVNPPGERVLSPSLTL